jgi:precorrin-6A synthase
VLNGTDALRGGEIVIELHLIGIGTGDPAHLTEAARMAMNAADLILLPRKGDRASDLMTLRRAICAAVLTGPTRVVAFDLPERDPAAPYRAAVDAWHDDIAAAWRTQISMHLPQGGRLALLVWGDPSLYDSTLRIAERLRADGMDIRVRVVPGITALQALTAAHAIPLNDLAAPVLITTGRRLRDGGWPAGVDTLAVMLDGGTAFETLDAEGIDIWWGAYLGMEQQALIAGPLHTVGQEIARRRAALRREHGWIMDVYLLRRTPTRAEAPPGLDVGLSDVLQWRRDVRHFRREPIAEADMQHLLHSAALAPSVGNAQPWRFVRVRSPDLREALAGHVDACSAAAAASLADPDLRQRYRALKLHGLREAPEIMAVFSDEAPGAGHGLGIATMPEALRYSTVMAIHTIWLAAAARGIGLGWVSILDPHVVAAMLNVPEEWTLIGLLCIGYPAEPATIPELERRGWQAREPIADRVIER